MEYHPGLIAFVLWIILLAALDIGGHASYVKGNEIDRRQAEPEPDIGIKKCDGIRQLFADGLMKVDIFMKRLRECNGELDREPYVDEVARLQAHIEPQQVRYQIDQAKAPVNQPKIPIIDRSEDDDKQGVARMMIHPNSEIEQQPFFGYRRSAVNHINNRIEMDPDRYRMGHRDSIVIDNNYPNIENLTPHRLDDTALHQIISPVTSQLLQPNNRNGLNPQQSDPQYQHPFKIVKKDGLMPMIQDNDKLDNERMRIPTQYGNPLEDRLMPHNNDFYGNEGRYTKHNNPRSEVEASQEMEESPTVFNYGDLLTLGLHDTASFMDAGPINGRQQSLTLNAYESLAPSDTAASVSRSYIDNNRENMNAEQQQSIPLDHTGLPIETPRHDDETLIRSMVKPKVEVRPGVVLSSALNQNSKPKIHSEKITAANLATIFKELDEDNDGKRMSDVSKKDDIEEIGSSLNAIQPINGVQLIKEQINARELIPNKSKDNEPGAEPEEPGFNLFQLQKPKENETTNKNGTDSKMVQQNETIKRSMLSKVTGKKGFNLTTLKFGMNNGNSVK